MSKPNSESNSLNNEYDFLFISDFHIARGYIKEKRKIHPREDFYFDEEFRRFLQHMHSHPESSGRKWELVFVGDCFDFLPIEPDEFDYQKEYSGLDEKYHFLATENLSIERLRSIHKGHPRFFEVLAWWIGNGNRLVIMTGNHDLELYWPGVQQTLKDLLWEDYQNLEILHKNGSNQNELLKAFTPHVQERDFKNRIDTSNPWFYYKKGVFYAEHATQYDLSNSVINFIDPRIEIEAEQDSVTVLDMPVGSIIVDSFVGPLEDAFPEWENLSHIGSFIGELYKERPRWFMNHIWRAKIRQSFYPKFNALIDLYVETGYAPDLIEKTPRHVKQHNEKSVVECIRKETENQGLPAAFGEKLYFNWGKPIMVWKRFRGVFFGRRGLIPAFWASLPYILLLLLVAGILFGLYALIINLFVGILAGAATTLMFVIGLVGLFGIGALVTLLKPDWVQSLHDFITRSARESLRRYSIEIIKDHATGLLHQFIYSEEYVYKAATRVHSEFRNNIHPDDIPQFYIMGHDHRPEQRIIENDTLGRDYQTVFFNAGSWLPSFLKEGSRQLRTQGLDVEFAFIKIYLDTDTASNKRYKARMLRWNDAADRQEIQWTAPLTIEDEEEQIRTEGWGTKEVLRNQYYLKHKWYRRLFAHLGLASKDSYTKDNNVAEILRLHATLENAGAVCRPRFDPATNERVLDYWVQDTEICRIHARERKFLTKFLSQHRVNAPKESWIQKGHRPDPIRLVVPIFEPYGSVLLNEPNISSGLRQAIVDRVNDPSASGNGWGYIRFTIKNFEEAERIIKLILAASDLNP